MSNKLNEHNCVKTSISGKAALKTLGTMNLLWQLYLSWTYPSPAVHPREP